MKADTLVNPVRGRIVISLWFMLTKKTKTLLHRKKYHRHLNVILVSNVAGFGKSVLFL